MLELHEIEGVLDSELVPFARLIQTLFPPEEQVLFSEVIELAQAKSRGEAKEHHFLTARDPESRETVAMAWYWLTSPDPGSDRGEDPTDGKEKLSSPGVPDLRVAWLWYIAVDPRHQSQGCGGWLYREICRRVFHEHGCGLMVLEVERVDVAARHSEARAADARRRLRFYQDRCGAQRLEGIEYIQETGWQPGLPMHLLIQWPDPARPGLSAEASFHLLKGLFGDQLRGVEGVSPWLAGSTAAGSTVE